MRNSGQLWAIWLSNWQFSIWRSSTSFINENNICTNSTWILIFPCFSSLAYALSFSPLDIDIISIFRHNTDSDRIAKSNHMDVALCQLYFVFLFVVPSNLWETQSIQSKLAVRNSHNRARVVDHRRISALWISDKR